MALCMYRDIHTLQPYIMNLLCYENDLYDYGVFVDV